jgi:hypothetical protein
MQIDIYCVRIRDAERRLGLVSLFRPFPGANLIGLL